MGVPTDKITERWSIYDHEPPDSPLCGCQALPCTIGKHGTSTGCPPFRMHLIPETRNPKPETRNPNFAGRKKNKSLVRAHLLAIRKQNKPNSQVDHAGTKPSTFSTVSYFSWTADEICSSGVLTATRRKRCQRVHGNQETRSTGLLSNWVVAPRPRFALGGGGNETPDIPELRYPPRLKL